MSEEIFSLHLKRSMCHIPSEKWMLYEKESAVVTTALGSSSVAIAAGTPTPCEAQHAQCALGATTKQAKHAAKPVKKNTGPLRDDDAPQGKPSATLVADGLKHRDRVQSATALADALLAKVESGGDWTWASGSAVVKG